MLEEKLADLIQYIEEELVKVKDDFSVRTEKYERYQVLKRKRCKALSSEAGSGIFDKRKVDVEVVFGQV